MTAEPPHRSLLARLESERAHHDSCADLSRVDECRIAHSSMAAGLHIAAIRLVEEFEGPEAAREYMRRTTPQPSVAPAATPEPDLYFCPTAEEVESATHSGFDQCCGHPELHVPLPDSPGTQALSELLSQRQRDIHAAQNQTDDGLREQCAAAIDRLRDSGGVYSLDDFERDRIAEVVLAVRDRRMEQLAAGRQTWKTKALEMERDRDRSDEAARRILDQRQELAAERYAWQERALQAEAAIARVRQMVDAWEQRLPDAIRTATAVEAIRAALPGQPDRPGTWGHIGGNAEDCPGCDGTNPPYPFICPGSGESAT